MAGTHGRHLSQIQISILVQMPDSNKIESASFIKFFDQKFTCVHMH